MKNRNFIDFYDKIFFITSISFSFDFNNRSYNSTIVSDEVLFITMPSPLCVLKLL